MFEWDEDKRRANIAKHSVDFVRAAKMFDNAVLERSDDREDYGEERIIALGHFENFYMVVVYTWRGGRRRIISAWRARRHEIEVYHQNVAQGPGGDEG